MKKTLSAMLITASLLGTPSISPANIHETKIQPKENKNLAIEKIILRGEFDIAQIPAADRIVDRKNRISNGRYFIDRAFKTGDFYIEKNSILSVTDNTMLQYAEELPFRYEIRENVNGMIIPRGTFICDERDHCVAGPENYIPDWVFEVGE